MGHTKDVKISTYKLLCLARDAHKYSKRNALTNKQAQPITFLVRTFLHRPCNQRVGCLLDVNKPNIPVGVRVSHYITIR